MLGMFRHGVSPSDATVPARDRLLSGAGLEDDEAGRISSNLGGSDILVGDTEPLY